MNKLLPVSFLFFTLFSGHSLRAQLTDVPVIYDTLYSNVLKEKRPLEIVLPDSYKPGDTARYDVLYTTDGEYTTRIVSSFAQFLAIQFLPANIVVSIPNTTTNGQRHRERDMLPTNAEGVTESGGAANFLAFIRDELMPYINKKYRSSGVNTLYGSSYAGVFTMFAFLKEPHLFQSFLLADPAFHWDNEYMIRLAGETLPTLHFTNTTLLITGREGAPLQYMGVAAIDSVLKAKAPAGLRWKVNVYSDETHNSMIFRTVYDGLKYTYYGFSHDPLEFYPRNGIFVKGQPIKIMCNSDLMRDIRYTTDGSMPTRNSQTVQDGFITLTTPSELTVKAFCNRDEYSKTGTGHFPEGTPLPAVAKPGKAQPGGFSYAYYEGSWDSLPDFKKLKPVKAGLTDSLFDIHKMPKQDHFACLMQGYLEVKEDGYYLFGMDCGGGARLYLGKQQLFDYNGVHEAGHFQSFTVPLLKGFYPFRLEYFQKQGGPDLQLVYVVPGKENPDNIPFQYQYHTGGR
ncbi:MAG: alpha/beta hydrolase-fold protein [Puia sp.]|nr:alpha/beta hydrolase-fold protein [Puia sp.]